ncbi:MAG: hypothetical protein R3Y68_06360 [Rikenellaceae bacterium]
MSKDESIIDYADRAYNEKEKDIEVSLLVQNALSKWGIHKNDDWSSRKIYHLLDERAFKEEITTRFRESDRCAKALITEILRYCTVLDDLINRRIRLATRYRALANRPIVWYQQISLTKFQYTRVTYFIDIEGGTLSSEVVEDEYADFKSIFDRVCDDWGYGRPFNSEDKCYGDTMRQMRKRAKQLDTLTPPSITSESSPIDEIIICQDTERAKGIIKSVMNGTKNKTACIAIRALIMAEIIKSDYSIARCKIFKIISDFIAADIGTNNSIGRHWAISEDAAKEKCNQIKKLL